MARARLRTCIFLSLGLVVFLGGSAFATPVLFETRAAFEAAVGPHTLITFDDLPTGGVEGCPAVDQACVLTIGPVRFVTVVSSPMPIGIQPPLLGVFPFQTGSNTLISAEIPLQPNDFFADFSGNAFAVDLFTPGIDQFFPYEVWLVESDGTQNVVPVEAGFEGAFVGAFSPTGFSRASFVSVTRPDGFSRANVLIDNVAVTVPEPSVVVLYGLALVALTSRRFVSPR
jgi:hypothetical protein